MSDLIALTCESRKIVERHFSRAREAEAQRQIEIKAATQIQSIWRGHLDREYLEELKNKALVIQCCFRSSQARNVFSALKRQRYQDEELAYFNDMATKIQKMYRGHLSRVYKHDYYRRKQYIEHVHLRAQTLRQQLAVEQNELQALRDEGLADEMLKEFDALTVNMHHLVGTQSQYGIFNQITAFDIPMEYHLKQRITSKLEDQQDKKHLRQVNIKLEKKKLTALQHKVHTKRQIKRSLLNETQKEGSLQTTRSVQTISLGQNVSV